MRFAAKYKYLISALRKIVSDVSSDLNAILPYYSPKFKEELKELFPRIEQGLKDGVIDSKTVQRFNSVINKCVDATRPILNKAVKKHGYPQDYNRKDVDKTTEYLPNFDYKEKFYEVGFVFHSSIFYDVAPSRAKGFIEKYEKFVEPLSQEYPEFGKALETLIKMAKDFLPIQDILVRLEDIKTNKSIEKYRPPQSKIGTMKNLYDILEKFISDTRTEMIAYWEDELLKGANRVVQENANQSVTYKEYKKIYENYLKLLDTDHSSISGGFINFRLKKDANQIANKEATEIADDIKQGFLAKSVNKLASIIENRGDYTSAEKKVLSFKSGSIEGKILVNFKNGDRFVAYLQVATVVNQNGTVFTRYPLSFHDVNLGGKAFKKVSEEWMNENFKVAHVVGSEGFKNFDDPWKGMSQEDRKEANRLFKLVMKAYPSSPKQIELNEKLKVILKKYKIGKNQTD